jgi:hypothetical protein
MALVWDNCGPHCTAAVKQALEEAAITVLPLYPNTTSHYQVQDVVVNSLFKSAFWQVRGEQNAKHFAEWQTTHKLALSTNSQIWKLHLKLCALAAKEKRQKPVMLELCPVPRWDPPKPRLGHGVDAVLKSMHALRTPQAEKSIARCFVNLGLAPTHDGKWLIVQSATNAVHAAPLLQESGESSAGHRLADFADFGDMTTCDSNTSAPEDSTE